ncbi:hypothetical protein BX070DRAFT_222027 [Coemansia spiralis]|nr:hypothetical protein BX070DRAFT_222027 [Coemansia spiralis]
MQESVLSTDRDRGTIASIEFTKTCWTTDQSKMLLQLAKTNREDNNSVAWKDVMVYVSGWTTSSCAKRYQMIMENYCKYLSGANITDHYKDIVLAAGDLLQECHELDEKFRANRLEWTLEQDVEMLELLRQGKKSGPVAEALGMKSGKHCLGRIRQLVDRQVKFDKNQLTLANPDQFIPTGQLPNGRTVMLGQVEFIRRQRKTQQKTITKPRSGPTPKRLWTQADDDKLYDLVMQRGKFVHKEIREHFPGVPNYHFYQSLNRILGSHRDSRHMFWTEEEEEALMQLVEKHGTDWRKIAKEMPTERNPSQCYTTYRNRFRGIQRRENLWPEEESLRLEIVVELFMQNKLLPFSQQKNTLRSSRTLRSSLSSVPAESASVDELKEKLDRLRGQSAHEELSEDSGSQENKKIDWKAIAPYMASKTPKQCYHRWYAIQRKIYGVRNSLYEGPWTREEDLELYKLYAQSPRRWRWRWISENLPRLRDVYAIQHRYFKFIRYYIDLLINQRGNIWDPASDQFEEVHKLCEIKAWRRRHTKGYRIRDGYGPPADLDINGDKYCFENFESRDISERSDIDHLGVDSNILLTFSQDQEGSS